MVCFCFSSLFIYDKRNPPCAFGFGCLPDFVFFFYCVFQKLTLRGFAPTLTIAILCVFYMVVGLFPSPPNPPPLLGLSPNAHRLFVKA